MTRDARRVLTDICDGARSRPGPIALAFLSLTVGIAALCLLLAVLQGLEDRARQLVEELGVDVAAVFQDRDAARQGPRLADRHAALLRASVPGATVTTSRLYAVPTIGTHELVALLATDDQFLRVRQWRLAEGRFLDAHDMRYRERSAVVSETLSRQWGWNVGSLIMLQNLPFKVVGIASVHAAGIDTGGNDPRLAVGERVVLVPKTVVPVWSNEYEDPEESVDAVFVRTAPGTPLSYTVGLAQHLLNQPGAHVDGLSWVTPQTLVQRIQRLRSVIAWAAGTIATLCLILGGTTLMTVMIAGVRERTTEIGLRRALGATRTDIALLFVLEACAITCCAGVVAATVTQLVLLSMADKLPVPVHLGPANALAPIAVALLLGMLFAYWPASAAARITPSEALRGA